MIGIFTFLLILRGSMLVGWWELVRRAITRFPTRQRSDEDFIINGFADPKHMSLGKRLASEKAADEVRPAAVLPDPEGSVRQMSVIPEAGDVTKRHEKTTLFDESDDDGEERQAGRVREEDVV